MSLSHCDKNRTEPTPTLKLGERKTDIQASYFLKITLFCPIIGLKIFQASYYFLSFNRFFWLKERVLFYIYPKIAFMVGLNLKWYYSVWIESILKRETEKWIFGLGIILVFISSASQQHIWIRYNFSFYIISFTTTFPSWSIFTVHVKLK